jgi:hypothetical protein
MLRFHGDQFLDGLHIATGYTMLTKRGAMWFTPGGKKKRQ